MKDYNRILQFRLGSEIDSIIPIEDRGNIVGEELFFKCPSPDHDDNTYTNCSINLNKGLFYCFACGFKGNLEKLKKIYNKNRSDTNNYSSNIWYSNSRYKRKTIW